MDLVKPLISVIVPVYNVERYISRCIDSILSQSVPDWELLLVDDGSQDSSGQICDMFSRKDSRIQVYHITNGGVSRARNYGIDRAKGEWICFIDADDWIDSNTFELCRRYSNYDFIRFSIEYVYSDQTKNIASVVRPYSTKEDFLLDIISRKTLLSVVAGFYKHRLFDGCGNLRFNHNITVGEDWLLLAQLVNKGNRFVIDQNCYYKYNKQNESSCTNSITSATFSSLFAAYNMICNLFDVENQTVDVANAIRSCKANIGYQIFLSKAINDDDYLEFKKKLQLSSIDILKSELTIKQKTLLLIIFCGARNLVLKLLQK